LVWYLKDGAFLEPSGRNQWQLVANAPRAANPKAQKDSTLSPSVALVPFSVWWTRSMTVWMPPAAPSIAGNASTIESLPLCQSIGAAAPTTPGTVRSFAAISAGSAPCSMSTSNGFITPALMAAAVSWSRPTIASPDI